MGNIPDHCALILQDQHSTFTLSMAVILQCLLLASERHEIPKIDKDWEEAALQIISDYDDPEEFSNPCELVDSGFLSGCDECGLNWLFRFRDNCHEFCLRLREVLKAYKICEDKGYTKEPCENFWFAMQLREDERYECLQTAKEWRSASG